MALECRSEATGEAVRDPMWSDAAPTYRRTWLLLARRLARMGVEAERPSSGTAA